ncbi:MAG: hypothetical protein HN396_18955 [Gemmatimonadales bacterium]|nr:hypothetical protein [Gemmatimonadales bacterium]
MALTPSEIIEGLRTALNDENWEAVIGWAIVHEPADVTEAYVNAHLQHVEAPWGPSIDEGALAREIELVDGKLDEPLGWHGNARAHRFAAAWVEVVAGEFSEEGVTKVVGTGGPPYEKEVAAITLYGSYLREVELPTRWLHELDEVEVPPWVLARDPRFRSSAPWAENLADEIADIHGLLALARLGGHTRWPATTFDDLAKHIVEGVGEAYTWIRADEDVAEGREDYACVAINLWAVFIGEPAGFQTGWGDGAASWFELSDVDHLETKVDVNRGEEVMSRE